MLILVFDGQKKLLLSSMPFAFLLFLHTGSTFLFLAVFALCLRQYPTQSVYP
ncbi:hypothetical protein SAMN05421747_101591 [Parapedobacter composti]|uniref:Uncharacterized protein n=1 Tax=Parapedobacter composti TaxID=623281 RepID=A0A1I1EHE1_9SPHI|nr:hypothetical protein SAMN05421747_101591 [Parapedobacter composti]